MKRIVLSCLLVFSTAAIADSEQSQAKFSQDKPIQRIIREMAKSDGISEAEAKDIATEVCLRLWGTDKYMKVHKCTLDEGGKKWIVCLFSDNGLDGWGCSISIDKTGHLEKAQYIEGL